MWLHLNRERGKVHPQTHKRTHTQRHIHTHTNTHTLWKWVSSTHNVVAKNIYLLKNTHKCKCADTNTYVQTCTQMQMHTHKDTHTHTTRTLWCKSEGHVGVLRGRESRRPCVRCIVISTNHHVQYSRRPLAITPNQRAYLIRMVFILLQCKDGILVSTMNDTF